MESQKEKTPDRMYVRWLDSYMRGFGMSFRTSDAEVEYIRADLHQAEADALHAELDRLVGMMEEGNNVADGTTQADSIDDLSVSVQIVNILKWNGIFRINDLIKMSENELLGIRDISDKRLSEIKEELQRRGLCLSKSGSHRNYAKEREMLLAEIERLKAPQKVLKAGEVTEPGWYWWRKEDKSEWIPRELEWYYSERMNKSVLIFWLDLGYDSQNLYGEFIGPIPYPEPDHAGS